MRSEGGLDGPRWICGSAGTQLDLIPDFSQFCWPLLLSSIYLAASQLASRFDLVTKVLWYARRLGQKQILLPPFRRAAILLYFCTYIINFLSSIFFISQLTLPVHTLYQNQSYLKEANIHKTLDLEHWEPAKFKVFWLLFLFLSYFAQQCNHTYTNYYFICSGLLELLHGPFS